MQACVAVCLFVLHFRTVRVAVVSRATCKTGKGREGNIVWAMMDMQHFGLCVLHFRTVRVVVAPVSGYLGSDFSGGLANVFRASWNRENTTHRGFKSDVSLSLPLLCCLPTTVFSVVS